MALGLSLNLLSSAVRQAGRMLQQRYFTTLTAAGGMYYSLASPVTLTGDFEIEFDFYISQDNPFGNGYRIIGFDANNFIKIFDDGAASANNAVILRSAGVSSDVDFVIPKNTLNRLTISRVAGDILFKLNDGETKTGTNTIITDILINRVGQSDGLEYLDGIISNLTIKQSGVLTNSWALDSDGTTSTEIDSVGGNNATRVNMTAADTELFTKDGADWVGRELITNGGFDSATGWTLGTGCSISGGVFATNGAISGELSRQFGIGIKPGSSYAVSYEIVTLLSSGLGIRLGGGSAEINYTTGVKYKILRDGTVDNIQLSSISNAVGSIDNVSAKRIIEVA